MTPRVFACSAVLAALNCADQAERVRRANSLADLVEVFDVEMAYDLDRFIGIVDSLPEPLVDAAMG
jgi:hypothetical protein